MKILFMGTPDFAVAGLERLITDGHEIVGVISQPDKPKGRGQQIVFPPVKQCAITHNLPVFQPETLRNNALLPLLEELSPELIVVIAYGKILPQYVLEFPKFKSINIHASLLPSLRGAAPIQWSIINGDTVTGITSMYMVKELDAGDILLKKEVVITDEDTAGTLHDKLMAVGADVLSETVTKIADGSITRTPQGEHYTYAPMLTKENTAIDFSKNTLDVYNFIRGLNPFPAAYAYLKGETFKILSSLPSDKRFTSEAGTLIVEKNNVYVTCGDGVLELLELVPQGKKKMSAADYFRGHPVNKGEKFSLKLEV